ncbi:hypothetical protein ACI3PL_22250, partial [Lacticaseibacillus paracasei]
GRVNVREKILLAAVALTETAPTITTPDLVMRAWSLYPEAFSLAGYAHPHSNAVIAKLSGADGLVGLGWLERTDESAYRVTRAGHAAARRL